MATLLKAVVMGVATLVDSATVGAQVVTGTNGPTPLTAGQFISTDNPGAAISPASSAGAKAAVGFVLAPFAANAAVTYYTRGQNNAVMGVTEGRMTYLAEDGEATSTPVEPVINGIRQTLGFGVLPTVIEFVPGEPFIRV